MRVGVNGRFLAARHRGGVQRFAFEVTARLADRCDLTLFVPRDAHVPEEWPAYHRVVRGRLRGHAWEQLEFPFGPSVDVFLHPANTAPVLGRGRHVLMIHDVFPLHQPRWYAPPFATAYRIGLPLAAARAARIMAPSAWSARQIAATLGLESGRIAVVPQGLSPFDAPLSDADAARELDALGLQGPFVLITGEGDARKNVAFAVRVLGAYEARYGPSPRLVRVGAAPRHVFGGLRPSPGDRAGLRLGRVSDEQLHALYTRAAVVLCPSLGEGFGRVPLEASCCGAPCLVADRGAAREILADSSVRLLPLDVDAWVAALQAVLSTGGRVPAATATALRRRWSWDAAASAVLDVCASALAIAPRPAQAGAS